MFLFLGHYYDFIAGRCGAPSFMAPEMIAKQPYGTAVDVWSAGVLMYLLLCGQLPFIGAKEHIYQSVLNGHYEV